MKFLVLTFFLLISFNLFSFETEFMPAFDCENSFRHHSYCFATQPKEWSASDKKQILNALNEWPAEAKAFLPEKVKMYRMGYGYRSKGAFANIRKKDVYAWVINPNEIYITDLFISSRKIIEGGIYSFNSYTLLHEIIHLFDHEMGRLSNKEEFLKLYNWVEVENEQTQGHFFSKKWIMKDVDQLKLESKRNQLTNLMLKGDKNEAAKKSLEFAAEYGLPTMYATTNPVECFAELITNYILAPELNSQLKPEALAWLESFL